MTQELTSRSLIPGIKGYVSAPCTYNVYYLNGMQTYTEKFAVIHIGAQYTGNASKAIDTIIHDVAAALAAAGNALLPGVGAAIAPLAELGLHWLKDLIFEADGSIKILLAYHSFGTSKVGFDPTFWPGGLEPAFWNGIVDSVMVAVGLLGNKHDNVTELDYNVIQKTNGNFNEAKSETPLALVKNYYSTNNSLKKIGTKGHNNTTFSDLKKIGIVIPGSESDFHKFLEKTLEVGRQKNPSREPTSRDMDCFSCKTIAYAAGAFIVTVGAIAAAELTVTSAIVIELAYALGISTALALRYISIAINSISYGVDIVVQEICGAAGCC